MSMNSITNRYRRPVQLPNNNLCALPIWSTSRSIKISALHPGTQSTTGYRNVVVMETMHKGTQRLFATDALLETADRWNGRGIHVVSMEHYQCLSTQISRSFNVGLTGKRREHPPEHRQQQHFDNQNDRQVPKQRVVPDAFMHLRTHCRTAGYLPAEFTGLFFVSVFDYRW